MCRVFSLLRESKGQSIVEFALILPLLLVVVGGAVDFGLSLFIGQVIENASRHGARTGAVIPPAGPTAASATFPACRTDPSPVLAATCLQIPNVALFSNFSVSTTGVTGATPNQAVTVQVSGLYNWRILGMIRSPISLLNFSSFPSQITISRSATMRWEWQPSS